MSSGEADAIPAHAAHMNSLDAFRSCEVPGCVWRVKLPASRCQSHGGPAGPQYAETSDGEIIDWRYIVVSHVD
jgi:hypothetical protein